MTALQPRRESIQCTIIFVMSNKPMFPESWFNSRTVWSTSPTRCTLVSQLVKSTHCSSPRLPKHSSTHSISNDPIDPRYVDPGLQLYLPIIWISVLFEVRSRGAAWGAKNWIKSHLTWTPRTRNTRISNGVDPIVPHNQHQHNAWTQPHSSAIQCCWVWNP